MKKILLLFLTLVSVSGCAEHKTWIAVERTDQFTDNHVKMVTVGESSTNNNLFTRKLAYYPFIGVLDNGDLIVGLRSGGGYGRIPVGNVRMRIDNNKYWEISTSETPLLLIPSNPLPTSISPVENQGNFGDIQKNMTENLARIMSPFTAATGDKAKSIIKEMINGKKMIYDVPGYNQVSSTTGEVQFDKSFHEAISKIGINND